MIEINVDSKKTHFLVTITEDSTKTQHKVTLSDEYFNNLSSGESKEEFIKKCFAFLLQREPKESILKIFNMALIQRHFPNFENEMKK